MRRLVILGLVGAVLCLASVEAFAGENLWRSVFIPGWGQVRAGHYGRGSLFLSAELVSLATLAVSDIQYRRASEQYESARGSYMHATYIGDAVHYYNVMHEEWDRAEGLNGYRRAAVAAAVGVWAVNIVDMILFDAKEEPLLSLDARPGGFLVTGALSF